MHKEIEAPFFRWYEDAAQSYLMVLKSSYVFANPPIELIESEEELQILDKKREKDLEEQISNLGRKLKSGHYQTMKNFDRYCELWNEIEANLIEAKGGNNIAYIYSLLRPFEPIVRAYTSKSTDEEKYIANYMECENICIPGGDFDDLEILVESHPEISIFALEFLSLVREHCNLIGLDFISIADYFHFPTKTLSNFNIGKILLIERDKGYRYFPVFDNRLHKKQPERTAKILPPELDTPRAREYLNKAQKAGFIANTSTGYKWVTDNKSECSYFCDLCSDALKLSKSENRTNWKPFVALFGYKAEDLRGAKNGWRNKTGLPVRHREIEAIFK